MYSCKLEKSAFSDINGSRVWLQKIESLKVTILSFKVVQSCGGKFFFSQINLVITDLKIGIYRVFQNKRSHFCVVRTMGEFLRSRCGSTVFCVPCCFCSGGRQNTGT